MRGIRDKREELETEERNKDRREELVIEEKNKG